MGHFKEIAIARGLRHNTDPRTSFVSAQRVVASGKLDGECKQIHEALKRFMPCTARELARESGIDYYVIQKRLSVLEKRGLARRMGERVCTASGTGLPATQWEAI